jgi:chromosome segregation ATPase
MLARARAEAEARRAADRRAFEAQARAEAEREKARAQAELERAQAEAEREKARVAAEQEKARIAAEQEKARAEAEREKARVAAEQEKARIAAEQEKARLAAEQEKARLAAEQEKARLEAEEKAQAEAEREKARVAAEREKARADAAHLAREAEERRQEIEARAEEARRAEAARLAREVEDKRKAEEAQRAEAERLAKEAEDKRLAEERTKAGEKQRADAARAALEARRMEEARRIAEKFRLAREARERARNTRSSLGGPVPTPDAQNDTRDDLRSRGQPTRVTVLLVMEPRRLRFGHARKWAHPVLCVGAGCYISTGVENPADYMPRRQALGPVNTIGRRAGACRLQLACTFRDVDLYGGSPTIQPVDMGFWHHDRREIRTAKPDRTCDVVARQLYCAKPILARGYRAWIVPESVAIEAGPEALEEALDDGLPAARSVERDDWWANVHDLPTR